MRAVHRNWRGFLSRLPVPMLALAASYGVYSFALLFVPEWVAIIQAAAYEITYIGLAVVDVPEVHRRRRAVAISIGAVLVSVIYNSAAGYLHRNPGAIIDAPWYVEALLAIAHGAPLAIVAGLNADLLLHTPHVCHDAAQSAENAPAIGQIAPPIEEGAIVVARQELSMRQLAAKIGVPESTLRRKLAQTNGVEAP